MDMTSFPLSLKTRNLVRFGHHTGHDALDESFISNFGFRDRGSRFSVLKSPKSPPGPDECFSLFERDARLLFKKLLGLEMQFPGLPAEQVERQVVYNSMNYYRSHIEEVFWANGPVPLPPIEGTCLIFFPAADRLVVNYALRNTSLTDVDIRLRWSSVGEPGLSCRSELAAHGFTFANSQKVMKAYEARAALVSRDPEIRFEEEHAAFRSAWVDRAVPAGETLEFAFDVLFEIGATPARDSAPPHGVPEALLSAIREAEDAYARLPELPAVFKQFEPLVLKALGTLRTLRYLDRDAEGRPVMTIHPGKAGCAATYFWDGAFTLLGLGLVGDVETGHGLCELLLGGIQPDGTPPVTFEGGAYHHGYQQPILAWGLGHFAACCPDERFLRRSYGPLSLYVNHWLRACDADGNGLCEYPRGGVCWDDALRWHTGFPLAFSPGEKWYERDWGVMHPHWFESVDTNAYLYLECRSLERMARRLGLTDDEAVWGERADTLRDLINRELYDEDAGVYQDRCIRDGRFSGMITPSSFMPLYAGIAPEETAARLCRDYLLNPDRFYTIMPFPTLDRSHPAFRSGGFLHSPKWFPEALVQHAYWIGRAWPHVSFWLVGALHAAGLAAEADAAALRVLDAMSRSEAIYECYDSLTGTGNGHAEFMWSSAAVLALAYQLYKKDPIARF